jgi:3',5'-cyclic AMP phosphodiesterase CpdA
MGLPADTRRMQKLHRFVLGVLLFNSFASTPILSAAEKPIARVAVICNLYLTDEPAENIPVNRRWIVNIAPPGVKQAIDTVNRLKPDALLVMGSLTWTGSEGDFKKAHAALSKLTVPWHVMPGERDLVPGGRERYETIFSDRDVSGKALNITGLHLQCFQPVAKRTAESEQAMLKTMAEGLANAGEVKAALLMGGPDVRAITHPKAATATQIKYWNAIRDNKVAAKLPIGHSHTVSLADSLPSWSIPAAGWSYSPKFHVALITVFEKRIELSLERGEGQPRQVLVIPNPVAADRMPTAAQDQFGVPTYSEDLATKPKLTFAQLSDSQFDDGTVPRYGARYTNDEVMNTLAVKQVNRLNPAMVFMTGDLTNKNTEAEWKTFKQIYGALKPPLHAMPGNHDTLYDRSKLDRKTLGDLLETGQKNWGLADQLAGKPSANPTALFTHFTGQKPYYAVEKNGCVFLCLNTGVAAVDPQQIQWLRAELERTKNAKHVFVLGHYPVLSAFGGNVRNSESRIILGLLKQYKVTAYLSGHRHRYNYQMHEGVMHILCDCLCWGEYCSYQVYHVYDDRIVACWKPIFRADGNRPLYERVVFPEPRFKRK